MHVVDLLEPRLRGRYRCLVSSRFANRPLRMADIAASVALRRYDAAHVSVFSGQAFHMADVASRLLRLRGIPFVMDLEGGALSEFHAAHPRRVERTLRRADRLVSPSLQIIDHFRPHGIDIDYLPQFVDDRSFRFFDGERPGHKLLWVRAYSDPFRPQLAIDAFAELHREYPDLTLTMVGPDKGSRARMEAKVRALPCSSAISISGPVPNDRLQELFDSHTIYLNTSAYESFGKLMVEAGLAGIPMVADSVGVIPRMWEDQSEVLLASEPGTEAFARQISTLLSDEELRASVAARARKKAETFTWSAVEKRWTTLFESLHRAGSG